MADFKTTCRGPNCGKEITMITTDPTKKPHPFDKPTRCPKCKGKGRVPRVQATLFGAPTTFIDQCEALSETFDSDEIVAWRCERKVGHEGRHAASMIVWWDDPEAAE